MTRKIILSLIVLMLMLSMSTVVLAKGALTVSNVEVNPGETVSVTFTLSDNPGFTMAKLNVAYPDDVLTLKGVTDGGILGTQIHSDQYANSPYVLYWSNPVMMENITANGVIATLVFEVKADAASGKYPITVTYDNSKYDIIDWEFNVVDIECINGSVTIVGGTQAPSEPKPEEPKPEESKPEESKPEETKPEETKPEETKPEETKPEETPKDDGGKGESFVDVPKDHWAYEAIEFVRINKISDGKGNGKYAPDDTVTRAEFITMLCRAEGIAEATGDNFKDAGDTWYTGYLAAAKQLGIAAGYEDGTFKPQKQITREEMVQLVYNYYKYKGEAVVAEDAGFSDDDKIQGWAKEAVNFSKMKGIISGKGNNTFDPAGNAKRSELAKIFYNMFNK